MLRAEQSVKSVGQGESVPNTVAPVVAPTADISCVSLSFVVKPADEANNKVGPMNLVVSASQVKQKQPLSGVDNGCHEVERKGVEPSTSALRTQRSPN
jgi:hypothetical protein